MSIKACGNVLGYLSVVAAILLHKALHHGWLHEVGNVVIIADTHACSLVLQLVLHVVAVPLGINGIIHHSRIVGIQ